MPKVLSTTLTLPRIDLKIKPKEQVKRIDPETPRLGNQESWSKKVLTPARSYSISWVDAKTARKVLVLGFAVMDVVLVFAYLMNVNSHASSGYEIKKLQQSITAEQEKTKILNIKLSEGNSILNMQSEFASENFVPVQNPTFFESQKVTSR